MNNQKNHMTGGYDMQDLLSLISSEGAEGLVLQVGNPPAAYLHGEENLVEGPPVTQENAAALFQNLATPDQVRELDTCGDVHFIYVSPKTARFGVSAHIAHEEISLEIRNLAGTMA